MTEQVKLESKQSILYSPTVRAFGALAIVFVIGLIFNADGAFYKWGTHRDMLRAVSVFGILACGMTLVIISGGIDLSVASILALTAVAFSLFTIHWSWSPLVAVVTCLVIGAICGAVSGTLIAKFTIQPFIATLAMMVFARGVAKWVSGGQKISTAVLQADAPQETRLTTDFGGRAVTYVSLLSTPSTLLPHGLAAAWQCGDRQFGWKAYTSQETQALELLRQALERFRCNAP